MPILDINGSLVDCELILFDFDGTLVEDIFRYRALGITRFDEIKRLAGSESAMRWAELSGYDPKTGNVNSRGPLARASRKDDIVIATGAIWQEGIGWFDAMELARAAYEAADKVQIVKYVSKLFPGTAETLGMLKNSGIKLGVATNGSGLTAREILSIVGVADLFDVFTGADDVSEGKPNPEMLYLACERTNIDPSKAVYVGDEGTDMEAGRNAGFAAVVAVEVDSDMGDLPHLVLDSVSDLASLLR